MERKENENTDAFNLERWLSYFRTLAEKPDNLDTDTWVAMLEETTHLFK